MKTEEVIYRKLFNEAFSELVEMQKKWKKEDEEDSLFYSRSETVVIYNEFCEFKKNKRIMFHPKIQKPKTKLICLKQSFSIMMEKHHVNEREVVFIPAFVHRAVYHRLGDGNRLEGVIG